MEAIVKKSGTTWNARKTAVLTTALLIAAFCGLLFLQDKNWDLDKVLSDTRIQQEKLMGEKLQLEKSVAKFKSDFAKMANENKSLSASLAEKLAQLEKMEKENKRFRSTAYQVDGLKKQKAELEAMMKEMEKDMHKMNNSISDLTAENSRIRIENKDPATHNASLRGHVSDLQEVAINNALVEAVQGKKKQRLTVVAKRTKGLKMEVDLPASMTENLHLKVLDPHGKELTEQDGTSYTTEVLTDENLTASLTMVEGELVAAKRMKLEFAPKKKLTQGTYTLEVNNGKKSLGKIQVKLR